MSDSSTTTMSTPQLKLPAVLDSAAAADLKRELLVALSSSNSINVDASLVQRVTTPSLQILAAAATSAAQAEKGRLRLHSVPRVLSEAINTLGLADALNIGEASQ